MVATPLNKRKIVHKRNKRFTKFEFEDYAGKLTPAWRKPRGIDCRVRRRFRGNKSVVSVGYGNNRKTRYLLPNGFKKFLITNEQDLEILLMNNRVYAGEISRNLSANKRRTLVQRARELNVFLTNGKAKLAQQEKEVKE